MRGRRKMKNEKEKEEPFFLKKEKKGHIQMGPTCHK